MAVAAEDRTQGDDNRIMKGQDARRPSRIEAQVIGARSTRIDENAGDEKPEQREEDPRPRSRPSDDVMRAVNGGGGLDQTTMRDGDEQDGPAADPIWGSVAVPSVGVSLSSTTGPAELGSEEL